MMKKKQFLLIFIILRSRNFFFFFSIFIVRRVLCVCASMCVSVCIAAIIGMRSFAHKPNESRSTCDHKTAIAVYGEFP